jgi:surface antigen
MIISRQLEEGMTLVRKDKNLTVKELIRIGRSCTAVVINENGKEEKLTITDMWNQKVTILNPDKKIPAIAMSKKQSLKPTVKSVETKKEKQTKKAGIKSEVKITEVKRANGIATLYHNKNGLLFSSWKRIT